VDITNFDQYADALGISTPTLISHDPEHLGLIYQYPNGVEHSARGRGMADEKASAYEVTECHRFLMEKYRNKVTKEVSKNGNHIDSMGRLLFLKFGKDPVALTLDEYRAAFGDPCFYDSRGKMKNADAIGIRGCMYVARDTEYSPLWDIHFAFAKGDEFYTAGLKNVGGKIDDFLQEPELKVYVQHINEIDTLALHRLIFEGMGRVSSGLLMGTTIDGGYRCQTIWDLNAISMFEPKVEKSKTGGKVKRYFVPESMSFFRRYVTERGIMGAWFERRPNENANYTSFANSLKMAGNRAGIWRYKQVPKDTKLAENEKMDKDGFVYRLKAFNSRTKATQQYIKTPVIEGKMTTTHTVGKHTGVSICGLHGFSLENCSQQSGTDAGTLKDYYHGTLGVELQKAVMGERSYVPWIQYVHETIEPLYTARYNELRKQGRWTVDSLTEQQEAALLGGTEE